MDKPKLEPCPFCGEEATIDPVGGTHPDGHRSVRVACSNISVIGHPKVDPCQIFPVSAIFDTVKQAATAWNRRTPLPDNKALTVEELREERVKMTTDEVIQRFEKQLTDARVVLDSGFGTHEGECDTAYRRRKEMAEIALDALRRTAEDDKAREEGRLHIATIADGTTIFRPIEYNELFDEPARVFEDSYIYGYTETVYGKMGKEWYLTRQEAEAALGGDQHG